MGLSRVESTRRDNNPNVTKPKANQKGGKTNNPKANQK